MATDPQLTTDEWQELGGCHVCLIHGCAQEQVSSATSIAPKGYPSTHLHPSCQQVLICQSNQLHHASVSFYCKDKPPVPAALPPCPRLLWKLRAGELQPCTCTCRSEVFGAGWHNIGMLPSTPSLYTFPRGLTPVAWLSSAEQGACFATVLRDFQNGSPAQVLCPSSL